MNAAKKKKKKKKKKKQFCKKHLEHSVTTLLTYLSQVVTYFPYFQAYFSYALINNRTLKILKLLLISIYFYLFISSIYFTLSLGINFQCF